MFSSGNFTASGLKFKSLIHFLCMVYDNGKLYILQGIPNFVNTIVKETIFPPFSTLLLTFVHAMVSYIWWIAWQLFWIFYHVSHITPSQQGQFLWRVVDFLCLKHLCLIIFLTLAVEVYTLDKIGMFPSPYKQTTHKRRSLSVSPAEDSRASTTSFLSQEESGNCGVCLLLNCCAREGGPLASIRLISPHGIGLFPTHQSSKTGKVPLLRIGCKLDARLPLSSTMD